MKLFKVNYSGMWIGGCALVFADSPEEAKKLVEQDQSTINFEDVVITELPMKYGSVFFNYNGDY